MRERHPHPSQQPLLPLAMAVSIIIGLLALRADGRYTTLVAGFAFAWFLVSFTLYWGAWILRDYAEWRDSRRDESLTDAE